MKGQASDQVLIWALWRSITSTRDLFNCRRRRREPSEEKEKFLPYGHQQEPDGSKVRQAITTGR